MSRRYRFDIWDIIIWISLLVLTAYILAKLIGLINTPEWINLTPIITLIFFAGAFYQKVLVFMERMYVRTDYLKKNAEDINGQITIIRSQLVKHEGKLSELGKKKK